jgi:hypothetical protein
LQVASLVTNKCPPWSLLVTGQESGDGKNCQSSLWVVLFFIAGMYILPLSVMGLNLSRIPGDLGDARLNNYLLEHGYRWLTGRDHSFWNAPFFFPSTNVMAFSDNHLGTLGLYACFRWLGLDRETAFQSWMLVLFCLNYGTCFWVLRRLSISSLGAAAGAFIFSFSLPMAAQMNHIQLLPRFCIPLAFYFAWEYMQKGGMSSFIALCVVLVWQFYCTVYIGLFTTYLLGALLVAHGALNFRRIPWRQVLIGFRKSFPLRTTTVLVSVAALLPLMIPYYKAAHEIGLRPWSTVAALLPTPGSYFLPFPGSLLWSWLHPIRSELAFPWEHWIFPGVIPYGSLLAVAYLCFRSRLSSLAPLGLATVGAFLILVAVTLSVKGISLYRLAVLIPGVRAVQGVSRIVLVLVFLLALQIGILLTYIEHRRLAKAKTFARVSILLLLFCIIVFDQYCKAPSSFDKKASQERSALLATKIRTLNEATGIKVFCYMPETNEPFFVVHLDAMMAAQSLGLATVNGYSGNCPRNYPLITAFSDVAKLEAWVRETRSKFKKSYRELGYQPPPDASLFNVLVVR